MKICGRCKINQTKKNFGKDTRRKDMLNITCKTCICKYNQINREKNNKRSNEWYLKNKDLVRSKAKEIYHKHKDKIKINSRKNHLLRKFKMSIDEYNTKLIQQNNRCKICEKSSTDEINNFAVDHCHSTGVVRGLLCRSCNTGIGKLKDSIELLKKAQLYIEKKGDI